MSLNGILLYVCRALAFAIPLGMVFVAIRILWLRFRRCQIGYKQELLYALFVVYLAALLQITVIRGGVSFGDLSTVERSTDTLQLLPLWYTFSQLSNGVWAFVYPVMGNIVWFFPFGCGMRLFNPQIKPGYILLLCGVVSCLIELLQWLFVSGISDIDDVILNICGGALGIICGNKLSRRLK